MLLTPLAPLLLTVTVGGLCCLFGSSSSLILQLRRWRVRFFFCCNRFHKLVLRDLLYNASFSSIFLVVGFEYCFVYGLDQNCQEDALVWGEGVGFVHGLHGIIDLRPSVVQLLNCAVDWWCDSVIQLEFVQIGP
jgi:hypothetical protein